MKYIKTIFMLSLSLCLLLIGTALAQEYPCNGTIIKNAVNVRKSASAQSDKVGSLKNGDVVLVMGEETVGNTIWYQIEMKNGKPGYVRGDLIEVGTVAIPQSVSSNISSTESDADTIAQSRDTTFIESVSFQNFQITFKTQTTYSCDSIQTTTDSINGTTYTFAIKSGNRDAGWVTSNSQNSSQLAIMMSALDDDAPSFDNWAKQITNVDDLEVSKKFSGFLDISYSVLRSIFPDKSEAWIKAFLVDLIKEYSKNGFHMLVYYADDGDFNEFYQKNSNDIVAENGFCFSLWGMSNAVCMLIRETEKSHTIPVQSTSNTSDELSTGAASANDAQSANINTFVYVSLKSGANGSDVIKLQNRLAELAYFFEASNGKYGDSTVIAIKEFQKDANLKVTGTADEQTQQLLYSDEAWSIRADALDKKRINVDTYEKKANTVVKKWDKKKLGSYTASADVRTTKNTTTYSTLTMALPIGITLFDQYTVQLSIWNFDNIKKASPTLSISISTQYMYGTSGASVYIQTKNYNQKIDSIYLTDVNTAFKSKQIELQAYPDVAADLAKNGGTVKIGSNSYTISTDSQFYKAYKDVYQLWKDMSLDTIMAYIQFYERYQAIQKEWAAATPVPTNTPHPTDTPQPTSTPQPTDTLKLTNISHQNDEILDPYTLGFTFSDFHNGFINATKGIAFSQEIFQNGGSGMYWSYGLSPDGTSDFTFGSVDFRSTNETSQEGFSIWLNICYDDSPDHFEEWAASIHSSDDLYATNQYNGFKEMARLFIQTLAPSTSDESAYQVLSNAIQKSAAEGYQYHALLDDFSLGEGTGFPRAGDFEFNFAYGGNWLELDARRYQNEQSESEFLNIDSIAVATAIPMDLPTAIPTTAPTSTPLPTFIPTPTPTLTPEPVPVITHDPSIAENFLYASNGTEVRINAYIGEGGNVIIPDEIDGLPVTQLADESFTERGESISQITLSKNLSTIGNSAFKNSSVSEITFPHGLVTINGSAFWHTNISGILIIPESVEKIGSFSFVFTNISGLIIQNTCEIGEYAFEHCDELSFVYIKDGCELSLPKEVFSDNKALNIVVIPSSVTSISNTSFKGCNYVKIITPPGSYAEQYAKENFIMYETDTYDEYVAQYEALCIQDTTTGSEISTPAPDNLTTEILPSTASPTLGETNALSSARSYLSYNSFSHDGLIDQLKYEGYTTTEATYAADNCGANWNDQALKSALDYFDFTSFSYVGIINQLIYEQFTTEQATYAADNCGANWNDQAVKCAANYLSFSSFSRSGLIEQLEYEGFTHEQAVYGVEQNGY